MSSLLFIFFFFFFNDPATTEIYTLSLHDALPISRHNQQRGQDRQSATCLWAERISSGSHRSGATMALPAISADRSEEHTSELQSHLNLVCRLLLEKKKNHCTPHSPHSTATPTPTH